MHSAAIALPAVVIDDVHAAIHRIDAHSSQEPIPIVAGPIPVHRQRPAQGRGRRLKREMRCRRPHPSHRCCEGPLVLSEPEVGQSQGGLIPPPSEKGLWAAGTGATEGEELPVMNSGTAGQHATPQVGAKWPTPTRRVLGTALLPCFVARCRDRPPLREKARGLGKSSKWDGSSAPTVRKTGRRLWWEGQREGPGGLGGAATSTARLLRATLVIEMLKNLDNQGRLDSVLAKDSRKRTTARWIIYDWRAQLSRSVEVRAVRGSRGSMHGS